MELRTYNKYIDVDENFVAVFGEEVDRRHKNMWKTFIPHSRFYKLLEKFLPDLNREVPEPKPLWIFGAYGTGKTHAAFVVKHLLSDDISEVRDYLSKYEVPGYIENKIMGIRENNKVLVAYHNVSSDITSERKLLLVLQDKIQKELKRTIKQNNEVNRLITKTEIELLREKIHDNMINWDELIKRHEFYELGIESKEDLARKLEKDPIDMTFVEYLLDTLEEEGITVFRFNVDTFVEWLNEIFETGVVSRIVFIWDEFSDFFNQDHPPLTTLQKIAEITKSIPFYLILITHRHPEQFKSASKEDIKKLQARFNLVHYYMEDVTIYQLMSNVIHPKDIKEWKELVKENWEILSMHFNLEDEVMKLVAEEKNARLEDMKKLFPIHPYSVYLSARVSQLPGIGSYQRTLFKFLKGDDNLETISFKRFIQEYPKNRWFLLTPDFLWEYFFVSNESIHIFHQDIVEIINYWDLWKDKLSDEELRVFNVIMLLSALVKKVSSVTLLKPSVDTLKIAFSGTPLYHKLQEVLDSLIQKGAIAKSVSGELILTYMGQLDISNIEAPRFNMFIKNNEMVSDRIKLMIARSNRLSIRFNAYKGNKISVLSIEDLKAMRIPTIKKEPYQIGVVFGVMKESIPLYTLKEKMKKLAQNYPNTIFVISLVELGEKNWKGIEENYKYQKASEKANKFKEAGVFRRNIESILNSWLDEVEQGRFLVISNIETTEDKAELIIKDRIHTSKALLGVLENIIEMIFSYGLDKWVKNDTLWDYSKQPKAVIKDTLEHFSKFGKKGQFKEVYSLLVDKWEVVDVHGEFIPENCDLKIPVCAMREHIYKMFPEDVEQVSIRTLWQELIKPPFGLYPSKLGALIFSLLLKEFSEGYYYTDGVVYGELNSGNLTEFILDSITGKKEWYIMRLSYEQKRFSRILQDIFELDERKSRYPREAVISARMKLKSIIRYPLWTIKYSTLGLDPNESDLIDLLDSIIKNEEIERSEGHLPKGLEDGIKEIVYSFDGPGVDLAARLRYATTHPELYQIGFLNFIIRSLSSDVLKKELTSESILTKGYLYQTLEKKLREMLQEEPWAWKENEVRDMIQILEYEINLVRELSKIFKLERKERKVVFLEDFITALREKLLNLDYLPLWMYIYHPKLIKNPKTEISAILKVISAMISTQDSSRIRQKFEFNILYRQVSQNSKQLESIIQDKETTIRNWIAIRLSEDTEDSTIIDTVTEDLKRILKSRGPSVDEDTVATKIRASLNELRKVKLKRDIENSLRETLGSVDIVTFLRTQKIPVELIRYLPKVSEKKASEVERLIRELMELKKIDSENKLMELLRKVKEYTPELEMLTNNDIHYILFRSFLGDDWIEGFLTKNDFEELIEDMEQKFGEEIEQWTERQIRGFYKEWIKKKYQEEMYNRLQEIISKLPPEGLGKVIELIIKDDPAVGLKLAKLIKQYYGDINEGHT